MEKQACSSLHTIVQNLQTHIHIVLSPKLPPLWNLSGLFCADSPTCLHTLSLSPLACLLLESEKTITFSSFLFRKGLTMYPMLDLTLKFFYLCLPNAEIRGECHGSAESPSSVRGTAPKEGRVFVSFCHCRCYKQLFQTTCNQNFRITTTISININYLNNKHLLNTDGPKRLQRCLLPPKTAD